MATTTYVMFGTDVVSCIYADQWNKSSEVDAPIAGFVDASNGARDSTAAYRPSAELFSMVFHRCPTRWNESPDDCVS